MRKLIVSISTLLLFSLGAFAQDCYTPNWTAPSMDSMFIYVSAATLNGSNLEAGDAIGVFDGDECVGLGVLIEELTGAPIYLIIEVSRDDEGTDEIDGFTPGNPISFRFCDGGNVVNPAVVPTWVSNGTIFVSNDTCVVQLSAVNTAPTFTTMPDTVATEDLLYSSTVTATDVDGDSIRYSATELPGWLEFNDTTGVLSGTPTNDDVGYDTVTLRINDGTVDVDSTFYIRIDNANDAPAFLTMPDTVATEDVPYSSTVTAEDVDVGDSIRYSATELPGWLEFNDTTQVLSGTPTNDDVGYDTVTLRINDGTVDVDSTFYIRIDNANDAPAFLTMPDTVATEDVLYSSTVTAEDVDGDSIRYSATELPGWLEFNDTTQVLSGTPTNDDVGYDTVTLRINDGTVDVDSTFYIRIDNVNDAPAFLTMPDTAATEDALYTSTVTAEDVDGDSIRYSATELPGWLEFNDTTQVLSGTPTNDDVGDDTVTLRINDGTVDVDSTFIITVENTNDSASYLLLPDTVAVEDSLYSSLVTAEDMDGDSIRFSAPELPGWLEFNDTTQILSGTPTNDDVGDDTVTLRINDGTIDVDTTFIITVENTNDSASYLLLPDTVAVEDSLYSSLVTAEDVDGDSIRYSATELPGWLEFNDTTQILSGTPTNDDVGDDTVTLRISDGIIDVDTAFIITVENTNDAPAFTSNPDTVTLEDELYTYTATAEDIDLEDSLVFNAPVIPLWLSFDTLTHVLSGTPENDDVGQHSIVLTINDSTEEVIQTFVIEVQNVNDVPIVTSTPVTEARPGVAYSYTVVAEDVDGDSLSYTALVLPGWLTFDPLTHTLAATPGDGDVGDQFVTIRISDELTYVDHTFVISVGYGNHAPTFTSDPATSVVVGNSYVYSITAQDIDGDALTFSAPLLPDWLTFYPETNVISGVPQASDLGRHDVSISVSDGIVSADQNFPIFVENVNNAPTFTSTPITSVTAGELYIYQAEAVDADEDDLSFSALIIPDWLSFDSNTHILFGTPTNDDAGDHNVTLRVSDGDEREDQNFVISVDFVHGIAEIVLEEGILIYPNPTTGLFYVELSRDLDTEVSLEIIDPVGRVLRQEVFPPYFMIHEEYDLSGSPAGMYFIRIYDKSSQFISKLLLQ